MAKLPKNTPPTPGTPPVAGEAGKKFSFWPFGKKAGDAAQAVTGTRAVAVGVDNTARRAHGAISRVTGLAFYSAMVAGVLGRLGGIKFIGPAVFEPLSRAIGAPRRIMDETTMREAVHAPSRILGDIGGRLTAFADKGLTDGAERTGLRRIAGSVASRLSGASESVVSVETGAASRLKTGATSVFSSLGDLAERGVGVPGEGDGRITAKLKSIPGALRNAPETFAGANMTNVALKTAAVTGTAVQVTSVVRGVADRIHALKQMYCDMTGEEKISTRKLLLSRNVPEVVKMARGHIMKEFGPRLVLNLAGVAATYGFMKSSSKVSGVLTGGLMVGNMVHGAKVQGYALLPLYEAFNQLPELNSDQYTVFIGAASADAAKAGGPESALVQALGKEYAKEKTRLVDVLKEIENGQFDKRAADIVRANREVMEKRGGHKLAPSGKGNENAAPAQDAAEDTRKVIGNHTQRVLNEERMAPSLVGAGSPMR